MAEVWVKLKNRPTVMPYQRNDIRTVSTLLRAVQKENPTLEVSSMELYSSEQAKQAGEQAWPTNGEFELPSGIGTSGEPMFVDFEDHSAAPARSAQEAFDDDPGAHLSVRMWEFEVDSGLLGVRGQVCRMAVGALSGHGYVRRTTTDKVIGMAVCLESKRDAMRTFKASMSEHFLHGLALPLQQSVVLTYTDKEYADCMSYMSQKFVCIRHPRGLGGQGDRQSFSRDSPDCDDMDGVTVRGSRVSNLEVAT